MGEAANMNPISGGMNGESLNAIPVEKKPVDPHAPLCAGCGRWHGGGGNRELACLRQIVADQRAEILLLKGRK